MSENNFQEVLKDILSARATKSPEKRDKVADAVTLMLAATVATKEIASVLKEFRKPLPQAC
jgi:hypothetical protein